MRRIYAREDLRRELQDGDKIEQRIVEGGRKRENKKDFTLNRRKAREEEEEGRDKRRE